VKKGMKKRILSSLYDSLAMAPVRLRLAWSDIKEDEEAMEVIQVVMLIAVGVIAIAAVWAGVNGLLKTWWDAILGKSGTQDLTL
jgi:hypothetical protein